MENEITEKVVVKAIGLYNGHFVKTNKSVELKIKFSYDERVNIAKTIAFVNQNVKVHAKIGSGKPLSLGMFSFKEMKIDKDGQGFMKLDSELDYVDDENMNEIARAGSLITWRLAANIIMEE